MMWKSVLEMRFYQNQHLKYVELTLKWGVSCEETIVRGRKDGKLGYDVVEHLAELSPEVTYEIGNKLMALGKGLEDTVFTVCISCCWVHLAR